jgi:hypothetical protein
MDILNRFLKKAQISSFIKIHPVGAESFRADRETDRHMDWRTDMTMVIVAIRVIANAPKSHCAQFVSNIHANIFTPVSLSLGAWGSVVVKALRY